ncbi:MAG: pirin family protein [Bacteroidota bacterium]
MNRKSFLRRAALGGAGLALGAKKTAQAAPEQVGFNHLPNPKDTIMNTVLHKANTRGHANHGWLDTYHTFSFANYHNPERMSFGVLRVLNDDHVKAGFGFGTHGHENMEIISIPLEGDLEHQDSMGNKATIRSGDVQVMSAGSGIRHSEKNQSASQDVRFLQIWVHPRERNVAPRYDQITLEDGQLDDTLHQILSPNPDDEGVWVHQDAWFHMGQLTNGTKLNYELKKPDTNGVYAFLLEGEATINGQPLERRDGYGLWNIDQLDIEATADAKVLLMEVPMG